MKTMKNFIQELDTISAALITLDFLSQLRDFTVDEVMQHMNYSIKELYQPSLEPSVNDNKFCDSIMKINAIIIAYKILETGISSGNLRGSMTCEEAMKIIIVFATNLLDTVINNLSTEKPKGIVN